MRGDGWVYGPLGRVLLLQYLRLCPVCGKVLILCFESGVRARAEALLE